MGDPKPQSPESEWLTLVLPMAVITVGLVTAIFFILGEDEALDAKPEGSWQLIPGGNRWDKRMRTPNGWLVETTRGLTWVPDPEGSWR